MMADSCVDLAVASVEAGAPERKANNNDVTADDVGRPSME